jgi:hypothetical protein
MMESDAEDSFRTIVMAFNLVNMVAETTTHAVRGSPIISDGIPNHSILDVCPRPFPPRRSARVH